MATPSAYLIQDQNISIHYDGYSLVGKNGISSNAQKKGGGGIGGRKALNDISNSAKPSALQASKKNNSANVISIGKDIDTSRNKFSAGRKDNYSKGLEKKGCRKALADLTNSSKLPSVAEEQFLHNHQNCVKAQRKAMDMNCFLKEVGLDHDDVPVHLGASQHALVKSKSSTYQPESPTKHYVEVEEKLELIFYDQVPRCEENRACASFSPCVASPKSAKPPYISWTDDSDLDFALIVEPLSNQRINGLL